MSDDRFVQRVRERYTDPAPEIGVADGCPPAETPLRLVLGELNHADARHFAAHAGSCPSCASAWRLARDYAGEAPIASAVPRRSWVLGAGLAAAATIAALLIWLPTERRQNSEPVMRAPETVAVRSTIVDGASLPFDRFVLRWTAGPEGARYDVRITDASLRHIAGLGSLTVPEYQVPADALATLVDGDLILWQVDVILPDGARSTSNTFSARVARP